ncbi:MAG: [Fe-Fe] hydrogenase large subunit C-terminal domain-containing protein [Candidatus Krumholzibacteria bacterium]|nr:[Fe-Fe] hydrogenase large subunit C-terminal domain-containing protein [Candidatus Krumholzibacteria bacterium]
MQTGAVSCFVKTVPDRCRVCYTCVRECPAKAIRITDGQAQIIGERCIGCGNCVQVCSQGAKQGVSTIHEAEHLLASGDKVAAMLAPSFTAEFQADYDFRVLVGMVRALGFDLVTEVGFGADLVAERYQRLYAQSKRRSHIATMCPAVVGFVERYVPGMIGALAPIVSPMIAMARALRHIHGPETRIVFIGPCLGKKLEAADANVAGEVDVVLTFAELRTLLEARGIGPQNSVPADFDPPAPNLGALFSLSRGFLQTSGIEEDLTTNDVVAAYGKERFIAAMEDLSQGILESTLLEILFCNGCVMGAGMTTKEPLFQRRTRVSNYVRYRLANFDKERWNGWVNRFAGLDLERRYTAKTQILPPPPRPELEAILKRMGKIKVQDELNCGACGYHTCREHAAAIFAGFAESEMCLPYAIGELQKTVSELSRSNDQLRSTQEQLMHSERLASMGQLAAGIAHELNNPLGVVLMYAHLLKDEAGENSSYTKDLGLIAEQADRCKRIVADLLNFARENKVLLQSVVIEELVRKAVAAVPAPDNISVAIVCEHKHSHGEMDPEQITQVLTNLIANAYAAMPNGGRLTLGTRDDGDHILFDVQDTGCGIPAEHRSRLFQPFFTTKQIGKGTGLGLAVSYGIVKMHRGAITVETNADPSQGPTGTKFTIALPRVARSERLE